MPQLHINIHALRHNLAVVHERCLHAGSECMFVFKEASLHPQLTADIMKGSPVHRLGLVAWPNNSFPSIPGTEIHHVYAPSSMQAAQAATCTCAYIDSRFTLQSLFQKCRKKEPQIRLCLEIGDGRDGALPEELPTLCKLSYQLGFSIRGIAINFACLSKYAPTNEHLYAAVTVLNNMKPYCRYESDISAGGTDILELAEHSLLPCDIGEIRCGTGVMLGVYPLSGRVISDARQDTFRLEAQILECRKKQGRMMALFDMGTFHTDPEHLIAPFPGMVFAGASSGYTSFDVTDCSERLHEGMTLSFRTDYHSLSRALFSPALPLVMENA